MIIDDKLLIKNDYASRISPSRKALQSIKSADQVEPKRPIMPQHEGKGHDLPHSKEQRPSDPHPSAKSSAPLEEATIEPPSNADEESVTMSLDRYMTLTRELHQLRELETIIEEACIFSIKDISLQQINYKATIHKQHLTKLLHHMMKHTAQGTHPPALSPMESPVRECAVDEIEPL
jgi:hypothetical protein